ncbi:MAG: hypothetical protein KAT15_17840, partial [Bacteroidales bacterium]|nr:hypothetical protein [Bacteroidales bacterium]
MEQREVDAPKSQVNVKEVSEKLLKARGKSLVVSSSNDVGIQQIVNEINRTLGNVGTTIRWESNLMTHQGKEADLENLISRMHSGEVDALLMHDVNPAYTWHDPAEFIKGVEKVGLTVSLSHTPDETSQLAQYICPDNHYLESWNDAQPKKFRYSLAQPVINPIFNTRQFQETLLKWSGSDQNYYEFMNAVWAEHFMPLQTEHFSQEAFFDHTLQKGVFEPDIPSSDPETEGEELGATDSEIPSFDPSTLDIEAGSGEGVTEMVLYESVALGSGKQANNPWLQELPDPVSKICWENVAFVSPGQAGELDLTTGDVIRINDIEIPVAVQPGQAYGTIGIALGYGRRICGVVGKDVGVDVWPHTSVKGGYARFWRVVEEIVPAGFQVQLALTQTHHSMEGRDQVRESDLCSYT